MCYAEEESNRMAQGKPAVFAWICHLCLAWSVSLRCTGRQQAVLGAALPSEHRWGCAATWDAQSCRWRLSWCKVRAQPLAAPAVPSCWLPVGLLCSLPYSQPCTETLLTEWFPRPFPASCTLPQEEKEEKGNRDLLLLLTAKLSKAGMYPWALAYWPDVPGDTARTAHGVWGCECEWLRAVDSQLSLGMQNRSMQKVEVWILPPERSKFHHSTLAAVDKWETGTGKDIYDRPALIWLLFILKSNLLFFLSLWMRHFLSVLDQPLIDLLQCFFICLLGNGMWSGSC